ncbi:hypothetical protein HYPSUDRAFT_201372 [Hypholoma sublateritium FD-334 SS-4]|uniref:Uncharacterized protein n=1 Tax=Hypholoma sublateritium (strain FD-334 SS-4) TaxID=945553 RepID=A0A0D2MI61_HYPSF|nr:hypothetical protein HYPSUDRAFT_201372 [Hypholoma sublateritium FD-334 SS-4]
MWLLFICGLPKPAHAYFIEASAARPPHHPRPASHAAAHHAASLPGYEASLCCVPAASCFPTRYSSACLHSAALAAFKLVHHLCFLRKVGGPGARRSLNGLARAATSIPRGLLPPSLRRSIPPSPRHLTSYPSIGAAHQLECTIARQSNEIDESASREHRQHRQGSSGAGRIRVLCVRGAAFPSRMDGFAKLSCEAIPPLHPRRHEYQTHVNTIPSPTVRLTRSPLLTPYEEPRCCDAAPATFYVASRTSAVAFRVTSAPRHQALRERYRHVRLGHRNLCDIHAKTLGAAGMEPPLILKSSSTAGSAYYISTLYCVSFYRRVRLRCHIAQSIRFPPRRWMFTPADKLATKATQLEKIRRLSCSNSGNPTPSRKFDGTDLYLELAASAWSNSSPFVPRWVQSVDGMRCSVGSSDIALELPAAWFRLQWVFAADVVGLGLHLARSAQCPVALVDRASTRSRPISPRRAFHLDTQWMLRFWLTSVALVVYTDITTPPQPASRLHACDLSGLWHSCARMLSPLVTRVVSVFPRLADRGAMETTASFESPAAASHLPISTAAFGVPQAPFSRGVVDDNAGELPIRCSSCGVLTDSMFYCKALRRERERECTTLTRATLNSAPCGVEIAPDGSPSSPQLLHVEHVEGYRQASRCADELVHCRMGSAACDDDDTAKSRMCMARHEYLSSCRQTKPCPKNQGESCATVSATGRLRALTPKYVVPGRLPRVFIDPAPEAPRAFAVDEIGSWEL